jgi:hypothetical protein
VALNFTAESEFIRQIGRRQGTIGNASESFLGKPADITSSSESILVADGCINNRIIAFSGGDLAFEQLRGAYGEDPEAGTRESHFFDQSRSTSTGDQYRPGRCKP